jgi:hypothetical protein
LFSQASRPFAARAAIPTDEFPESLAFEYKDKGRYFLVGCEHEKPKDSFLFCAELCPEYIDFIKELLKQFPKSPYALRNWRSLFVLFVFRVLQVGLTSFFSKSLSVPVDSP